MTELETLLGEDFEAFGALDSFGRAGFILGCENWDRYDFKALLKLVKNFVSLIWDTRKNKLYGDQDTISGCSCSRPLTGDLTCSACVCGCVVNGVRSPGSADQIFCDTGPIAIL